MEFNVDPTRRRVLKAGASTAVVTTLASSSWMGLGAALAQQAKPLSFQLSWIKSIQYGGFFAGIPDDDIERVYGGQRNHEMGAHNVSGSALRQPAVGPIDADAAASGRDGLGEVELDRGR